MGFLNKLFGSNSPACDICDKKMVWGEGYGLSTSQVTTLSCWGLLLLAMCRAGTPAYPLLSVVFRRTTTEANENPDCVWYLKN